MKGTALLPRSRMDGLVIRELDDETLVYDSERDKAHCLNETAALVWGQCDGKTTVSQAAQSLQSKLEVPVDADIIWLAVKQLQRFHLIEKDADFAVDLPSLSRRRLLLKYAPAALVLPLIISISAPTPAQSATCVCPNCCVGFVCNTSSNTCVPDIGA
jgi:hypothetical protein